MSIARTDVEAFLSAQRSPRVSERIALNDMIREGLSIGLVENAAKLLGLSERDLTGFGVIASRTLRHSKAAGRLSAGQSDRVTRFFRIYQKSVDTFGTPENARAWLIRKTRALRGRRPVDLLDTEEGARLVESLLTRIDHGLAA
jgi:putative toxin-antitoxin system antitoxin component (TIGR02293 family)